MSTTPALFYGDCAPVISMTYTTTPMYGYVGYAPAKNPVCSGCPYPCCNLHQSHFHRPRPPQPPAAAEPYRLQQQHPPDLGFHYPYLNPLTQTHQQLLTQNSYTSPPWISSPLVPTPPPSPARPPLPQQQQDAWYSNQNQSQHNYFHSPSPPPQQQWGPQPHGDHLPPPPSSFAPPPQPYFIEGDATASFMLEVGNGTSVDERCCQSETAHHVFVEMPQPKSEAQILEGSFGWELGQNIADYGMHFEASGGIIHTDVQCDGCGSHPIVGPRFKSTVKDDYDLCRICFSSVDDESEYIMIDHSVSYLLYVKNEEDDDVPQITTTGKKKKSSKACKKKKNVEVKPVDAQKEERAEVRPDGVATADTTESAAADTVEKYEYQAEVINNKEVFLRELISNASDALDKLRFLRLTEPELLKDGGDLDIRIQTDTENGISNIIDSGIGMTREELVDCLGTIAQSGTSKFLKALKDSKDVGGDNNLIGQFGVGFYSSFLVADRVVVSTKSPKSDKQYVWEGEANTSSYTIHEEADPEKILPRGTRLTRYLKCDDKRFAHPERIQKLDFSEILSDVVETELKEAAVISMGTEISDLDLIGIKELCKQILSLAKYRAQLFDYLKTRMQPGHISMETIEKITGTSKYNYVQLSRREFMSEMKLLQVYGDNEQVLEFRVLNMTNSNQLLKGCLPLTSGASLTSFGFSEEGKLSSCDSKGVLRVFTSEYGGSWFPLFNASKDKKPDGNYWVVGAEALENAFILNNMHLVEIQKTIEEMDVAGLDTSSLDDETFKSETAQDQCILRLIDYAKQSSSYGEDQNSRYGCSSNFGGYDFRRSQNHYGVNVRVPFTQSQREELEAQTLIFKYIMACVPVPQQLLHSISNNVRGARDMLDGILRSSDPEPGRCKRTDGKKWRCSRDRDIDRKYCERHSNKRRSRKLVESIPNLLNNNANMSSPKTKAFKNQYSSCMVTPVAASQVQPRVLDWFMNGESPSVAE